jgi:hypothetical protein
MPNPPPERPPNMTEAGYRAWIAHKDDPTYDSARTQIPPDRQRLPALHGPWLRLRGALRRLFDRF